MRVFVASWFFPPSTSSEGIVTYKLLRRSKHQYDVCCSNSDLWGYKHVLPMEADNINLLPIDTDDLDEWVSKAVEMFCTKHEEQPYDAIMTRSMPPESILVAKQIHEKYPDIPWFASLADPMARSPYHLHSLIEENEMLKDHEKEDFQVALKYGCDSWRDHRCPEVKYLCELKDVEDYAINNATAIIFPCDTLKSYMLEGKVKDNAIVVPHSYDKSLYPAPRDKSARKTISFLGHTDELRSLEPLVRALHYLQSNNPAALEGIQFRFVGHITENVRSLVYNYFLQDMISIEPSVDYLTSLRVMKESDWLLHVDAYFELCEETGGSIFYAGKIADYMGTDAPILSLTGKNSPADYLTRGAGGISASPTDIPAIADAIARISAGDAPVADKEFRARFENTVVAESYDQEIERYIGGKKPFEREFWPEADAAPDDRKLISICIPAYNVEQYLDRCLLSLIRCKEARHLDIIVVNDGSKDGTLEIAQAYANHYPNIISVIDKPNGGHGSTINAAMKTARGFYFRVIDGDDWVDSINFDKQIKALLNVDALPDIVSGNYDQVYIENGQMVPWSKAGDFEDYKVYDIATSDLSKDYFTMASALFKTEMLQKADFQLQEHTFYVDVEYLLFPIPFAKTVMFTPESVYRYAVGNANQSINPSVFVKRYDHHDRVIRRMLSYYKEHLPQMEAGQAQYMKSLFVNRLLPSHYTLSLIWDVDRTRGCERAKDFDAFLKSVSEELYTECGKNLKAVKKARRASYDPAAFKKPENLGQKTDETSRIAQAKTDLVEALYKSDIGHMIAKNKTIYRVYEKYFRE